MSIVMNLYYTGTNGSARAFAEEMEQSGVAAAIRAEEGNERYEYFFPKTTPKPCCSSTPGAIRRRWTYTTPRP